VGGSRVRRSAQPDAQGALDVAVVEGLLVAALRGGALGAEGEQRAVDAFRAARDAGTHRAGRTARVRRRDDWRPRERRRARRSLRTTLSVVLASLTLGGVAYAAIGAGDAGGSPAEGTPSAGNRGPASTAAPAGTDSTGRPAGPGPSVPPSGATAASGDPTAGRDSEAHCRAYERVEGRGRALDATAWQRLVAAAGGERHVAAYCARQRTRQTEPATANDGNTGATGNTGTSGSNGTSGSGAAGNPGTAGNTGTAGSGPDGPAQATGNSGTSGNGTEGGESADGNADGNADGGRQAGQDRGKGE
jgi:hypothetical protein